MKISVVIPTFNPNLERFDATLKGLAAQSLPHREWECIIVDNASATPVDPEWCSRRLSRTAKVVREPRPGLSSARLAGIRSAAAELVVFCDDDNVLSPSYLDTSVRLMGQFPKVGVSGGKSRAVYLVPPPLWFVDGMAPLGCRDLGEQILIAKGNEFLSNREYPDFSPIGAGMVFRKEAMDSWMKTVGVSGISDRKGKSLSSAGDCDMVLHALQSGFDAAYWPDLDLQHLIPAERLTEEYLAAISRAAFRDFVKVLDLHGIRTWSPIKPWSISIRAMRAWFRFKAWRGPSSRIAWQSAVGQFEGRSKLR